MKQLIGSWMDYEKAVCYIAEHKDEKISIEVRVITDASGSAKVYDLYEEGELG